MSTSLKNETIFKSKKGNVSYLDFVNAYKQLGINKGDVLFLQTQFFAFGRLIKLPGVGENEILNQFIQDLQETVGEHGTLMMTTFSSEPLKTGIFDLVKTKSDGGVLTEFFRTKKDVKRSSHPTHSFAIWGKEKGFLEIDNSTFDDESIYGKLYKENATLLFWGAGFYYCTFNHFIEEKAKVSYRKKGTKNIRVIENGKDDLREIITYHKSDRFKIDFTKFEKLLMQKGLLKVVNLGDGQVMSIKAVDLFDEGIKALKRDSYFFLKTEPLLSYGIRKIKTFIKSILKKS